MGWAGGQVGDIIRWWAGGRKEINGQRGEKVLSSSPVKATMQNMILNSVLKVDTVL